MIENATLNWQPPRTSGWFQNDNKPTPLWLWAAPSSRAVGNLLCPSISHCTCKLFVTEHWKVNEGKLGRQLLSENIWINRTLSELSFPSKTQNCINQKHDSTVKFPHYSNLKQAPCPTGQKIVTKCLYGLYDWGSPERCDGSEQEARSYTLIFICFCNVRSLKKK